MNVIHRDQTSLLMIINKHTIRYISVAETWLDYRRLKLCVTNVMHTVLTKHTSTYIFKSSYSEYNVIQIKCNPLKYILIIKHIKYNSNNI